MFLGQSLSKDHSCRDAVHRLNSWRVAHGKKKVDSNTTSYCEARQRLPEEVVRELTRRSGRKCQEQAERRWNWKGHDVKVIDGTTLTMPDTESNQKEYPQQRGQKEGCGSPVMRCVMMGTDKGSGANGIVTAFYVIFRSAAIAALNIRRGTVISFSTLGRRLFSRGSMRPGRAPTTAHAPCT